MIVGLARLVKPAAKRTRYAELNQAVPPNAKPSGAINSTRSPSRLLQRLLLRNSHQRCLHANSASSWAVIGALKAIRFSGRGAWRLRYLQASSLLASFMHVSEADSRPPYAIGIARIAQSSTRHPGARQAQAASQRLRLLQSATYARFLVRPPAITSGVAILVTDCRSSSCNPVSRPAP